MSKKDSVAPDLLFNEKNVIPSTSDLTTCSDVFTPDRGLDQTTAGSNPTTYLIHRDLRKKPLGVVKNEGNWVWVTDSLGAYKVFDASGGAAVSCIGHNQEVVLQAMHKALDEGLLYAPSADFTTEPAERLAQYLIESTGFEMGRVNFYGSGNTKWLSHECYANQI